MNGVTQIDVEGYVISFNPVIVYDSGESVLVCLTTIRRYGLFPLLDNVDAFAVTGRGDCT